MTSKFTKMRKLGEGGMGEVWLVAETSSRALYAAKYLRHQLARDKDRIRFEREVAALKSLDHPNIVKVHGILDEGDIGYVMEYCPDGSLADLGDRSLLDVHAVVRQLSLAVSHMHAAGFVHRDIKPGNILIAPDGTIRLSDFGLVVEIIDGRTVITTSNWVSRGFAAPEQYVDMASVDHKADLFSVGAVLYFLQTGQCFDFQSSMEHQIDALNDFDRFVLRRLLVVDPNERFADAHLLLVHLNRWHERRFANYFSMSVDERIAYAVKRFRVLLAADELESGQKYDMLRDVRSQLVETLEYETSGKVREALLNIVRELEAEVQREYERLEYPPPAMDL